MGLVRDMLASSVDFVKEEILPLREDLIKAGLLTPERQAPEPKTSFVDPMAYNSVNYGYKEKFSSLSYERLRQIAIADPVVSSILQTRLNEVSSFSIRQPDKYKTGFRIALKDKKAKMTPEQKEMASEIEEFMLNCGIPEGFEDSPSIRKRDNFESFLKKITRDTLQYDQLNFEVVPRRNGLPHSFYAVDATTIRLVADKHETEELPGGAGNNLSTILNTIDKRVGEKDADVARFVQVVNGRIRHTYSEWDMAFGVRNPRTDLLANGYGFSELEMLITTITSHMNAETYNRKFFSQGTAIKGILAFEGSVPPDQLEAFRRQWHQQASGVTNAWKTPIMALGEKGKMNWQALHSTNKEMEFGNWMEYCIKTICGVFQIDPIQIGFDISKNNSSSGAAGMNSGGNSVDRLSASKDKGLKPLLRFIANLINEYIIYRIDPDFEFEFSGVNLKSEQDDLDQTVKEVGNYKTINEVRREHDLEDLPDSVADMKPGDFVLNASYIQALQMLSSNEQMEQEQEMNENGDMGAQGSVPAAEGSTEAETSAAPLGDEPDYENMSDEELQAELDKLEGGGEAPAKEKPPEETKKSFYTELIM